MMIYEMENQSDSKLSRCACCSLHFFHFQGTENQSIICVDNEEEDDDEGDEEIEILFCSKADKTFNNQENLKTNVK